MFCGNGAPGLKSGGVLFVECTWQLRGAGGAASAFDCGEGVGVRRQWEVSLLGSERLAGLGL